MAHDHLRAAAAGAAMLTDGDRRGSRDRGQGGGARLRAARPGRRARLAPPPELAPLRRVHPDRRPARARALLEPLCAWVGAAALAVPALRLRQDQLHRRPPLPALPPQREYGGTAGAAVPSQLHARAVCRRARLACRPHARGGAACARAHGAARVRRRGEAARSHARRASPPRSSSAPSQQQQRPLSPLSLYPTKGGGAFPEPGR